MRCAAPILMAIETAIDEVFSSESSAVAYISAQTDCL